MTGGKKRTEGMTEYQEKGTTEDETFGWHHRLSRHKSEQALKDTEACVLSLWGRKESNTPEHLDSSNRWPYELLQLPALQLYHITWNSFLLETILTGLPTCRQSPAKVSPSLGCHGVWRLMSFSCVITQPSLYLCPDPLHLSRLRSYWIRIPPNNLIVT